MIKVLDLEKRMTVDNDKKSSFRFDISFLRVLAVFAVVLYHYNIFPLRSGFVGVDIFFVISGFLMTKIILAGFEKNSFNLLDFYKRRVVRIFPALLVLLIIFCFIVFYFVPVQFFQYIKGVYSSSLFFSNIIYYLNNGYFSSASHNNFLLHTWSLSVEWQFYMVYPLILLLFKKIYRTNKKLFKIIFLGLVTLSFFSMLYHNFDNYNFSFYIFYTRAWEMLFGGFAFLYLGQLHILSSRTKLILVYLSYLVLSVSVVFFRAQNWPSIFALIPVFATTLIIGLNVEIAFIKNNFLKYLGDLSYSLYLYHWPIYVLSMFFGFNSSLLNRVILIFVSIFFAILSYEFIEKSTLFKNVKLVLVLSILIFSITFPLSKFDGNQFSTEIGNLMNVSNDYVKKNGDKQYNLGIKHFTGNKPFNTFDTSFLKIKNNQKKNIVLLGDSHGGMFAQSFENLDKNKINFIQITADGTYPMLNSKSDLKESVNYFNYIFDNYFKENKSQMDLVIISSNYAAYTKEEINEKIAFTDSYFKKNQIKYLYLGQTQLYPIDFPTYIYMKKRYNVKYPSENEIFEKTIEMNLYLKQKLGDKYIDIYNHKVDILSKNNYPYVYDMNHLTVYGTQQYMNIINQNINFTLNQ